jgi:delta14-sterol reductase
MRLSMYSELRPGLILWMILDICMVFKQYSLIGRVTDSMYLVLIFQSIYVFDAVYNEAGILTQMDITSDGFGFMLAVGDLTWVTFTYGLQTRYLALYPKDLGVFWTSVIVAVNCLGYYIFRVANGEKNDFRNGKNPKSKFISHTNGGTRRQLLMLCYRRRLAIHEDGTRDKPSHKRLVGSQSASKLCKLQLSRIKRLFIV